MSTNTITEDCPCLELPNIDFDSYIKEVNDIVIPSFYEYNEETKEWDYFPSKEDNII